MAKFVVWIESASACPGQSGFVDADDNWTFNSLQVAARYDLPTAMEKSAAYQGRSDCTPTVLSIVG